MRRLGELLLIICSAIATGRNDVFLFVLALGFPTKKKNNKIGSLTPSLV